MRSTLALHFRFRGTCLSKHSGVYEIVAPRGIFYSKREVDCLIPEIKGLFVINSVDETACSQDGDTRIKTKADIAHDEIVDGLQQGFSLP